MSALDFVVKSMSSNLGPPWVFMSEGFSGNTTFARLLMHVAKKETKLDILRLETEFSSIQI